MLTGRLIALRHPTECVRATDSRGVRQSTASSRGTPHFNAPTQTTETYSVLDGTNNYGWHTTKFVTLLWKPEPLLRAGPTPPVDALTRGGPRFPSKGRRVGLALAATTAASKAASPASPRDSA